MATRWNTGSLEIRLGDRLFRIELPHASGDIVVRKGLVTDATRPFRGIRGNELEKVRAWVRLRGGIIEEIAFPDSN